MSMIVENFNLQSAVIIWRWFEQLIKENEARPVVRKGTHCQGCLSRKARIGSVNANFAQVPVIKRQCCQGLKPGCLMEASTGKPVVSLCFVN